MCVKIGVIIFVPYCLAVFYKLGFRIFHLFCRLAIPSGQAAIGAGCAVCVVRSSCQHVALAGWLAGRVGWPARPVDQAGWLAGWPGGGPAGWLEV